MTEEQQPIGVGVNLTLGGAHMGNYPRAAFVQQAAAGGFPHLRSGDVEAAGSWSELLATTTAAGTDVFGVVTEWASEHDHAGLWTVGPDAYAYVEYAPRWGGWTIETAGRSPEAADGALAAMLALLPPKPPAADDNEFDITYWMAHPMMASTSRTQRCARLEWADVAANYPASLRAGDERTIGLDELTSLTAPPAGGRLMLFHGPPGTGKTRFIQTLAASWSDWCSMHYIVDPESMFRDALYLNNVMLEAQYDDRYRLVVIEDGDEFIDVNAKARIGQGLARLLNVADGFIGQSLKLMILVSTNVKMESFHAAATREGRCAATLEFPPFTVDEAVEWCTARGIEWSGKPDDRPTLATLYGLANRGAVQ